MHGHWLARVSNQVIYVGDLVFKAMGSLDFVVHYNKTMWLAHATPGGLLHHGGNVDLTKLLKAGFFSLRSSVGWAHLEDNDWHALTQKMNRNLENAHQNFNVISWTERSLVGRFGFAAKTASRMNCWAFITGEWYPYQKRRVNFCDEHRWRIGRPARFPFIMVSGGQLWDMKSSRENFCTMVRGTLMFGCASFPCHSRFDSDGNCVCVFASCPV